MKNLKYTFIGILGIILGATALTVSAQVRVFTAPQGGTGISSASAGDVGKFLKVSDDSPFTYTFDTAPDGTGTVSTSTNETAGRVPYWTTTSGTPAKLGEVATSSVTYGSPLTTTGTAGFILGGSGFTVDIDDIKAADLDLADITLNDFTNDANFID